MSYKTEERIIMRFVYIFIVGIAILNAGQKLTVSVVPQMETTYIQKTWEPFLQELSKKTGIAFELHHYRTIPEFEKGLHDGEPDIAFMNPYHAVMANEWSGYRPIIHDMKPLIGILVIKKNGAVHTLTDLNGKSLAFPSPNAFAASLYMRALLDQQEKIQFKPVYVKTHTNVYRNVLFGVYAAGGGVNNTLIREDDNLQNQLQILYKTKPTAPHPLCINPRVSPRIALIIQKAILDMGADSAYKDMLDEIQIPNPVSADYKEDYAPLKQLKLDKYIVNDI